MTKTKSPTGVLLLCSKVKRSAQGHILEHVVGGLRVPGFPIRISDLEAFIRIENPITDGNINIQLRIVTPSNMTHTLAETTYGEGFHELIISLRELVLVEEGFYEFLLLLGDQMSSKFTLQVDLEKLPATELFNLEFPEQTLEEVISKAERFFPYEKLSPSNENHIGERGELAHPVSTPYSAIKAWLDNPIEEYKFGPCSYKRVSTVGWALAELHYINSIASIVKERHSLRGSDEKPSLNPDVLFEYETIARYEKAGIDFRYPLEIDGRKKSEFICHLNEGELNIECKYAHRFWERDSDGSKLSGTEARRLAVGLANTIMQRCPINVSVKIDVTDRNLIREDNVVVTDVISLMKDIRTRVEQEDSSKELTENRNFGWGNVCVVWDTFASVGGLATKVGRLVLRGIHPLNGYAVAFGTAHNSVRYVQHVCLQLPAQIFVGVGPVRSHNIDDVVKRQFEKATKKVKRGCDPLFAHIRIAFPNELLDRNFIGDLYTARVPLVEIFETAIHRIEGLLKKESMPKGLIGCEISVVGAQGDEIREGKLFERARFLVNPINEKAQRFIDELIDRGVLTYS